MSIFLHFNCGMPPGGGQDGIFGWIAWALNIRSFRCQSTGRWMSHSKHVKNLREDETILNNFDMFGIWNSPFSYVFSISSPPWTIFQRIPTLVWNKVVSMFGCHQSGSWWVSTLYRKDSWWWTQAQHRPFWSMREGLHLSMFQGVEKNQL